ncbi:MAG TPA: AIR synthase family protein [Syntrophobacteria bacterium]|nr:AIR synthase family protein [Syntrophobacteria bacterium]
MAAGTLPQGKLKPEILARLLGHTSQSPELVVGPALGEDAAVIDQGDRYLVVTTDPITFTTRHCGWYSVCVNANDIAACGGTPRYYSAAILLPEGRTTLEDVKRLFVEIENACRRLGVLWVGGHTEVSPAVTGPLVVGQMIGEVAPEHLCKSGAAKEGDALLLVKTGAIEATAIIATERAPEVEAAHGPETARRCRDFLFDPGLAIVREASLARGFPVRAMHDPTEGGVITGIREICAASNCGVLVRQACIGILPETAALCSQFGLDPLGAISSGALLLTLPKEAAPALIRHYNKYGIPASVIGEILHPSAGLTMRRGDGSPEPLPEFAVDEITKLFS